MSTLEALNRFNESGGTLYLRINQNKVECYNPIISLVVSTRKKEVLDHLISTISIYTPDSDPYKKIQKSIELLFKQLKNGDHYLQKGNTSNKLTHLYPDETSRVAKFAEIFLPLDPKEQRKFIDSGIVWDKHITQLKGNEILLGLVLDKLSEANRNILFPQPAYSKPDFVMQLLDRDPDQVLDSVAAAAEALVDLFYPKPKAPVEKKEVSYNEVETQIYNDFKSHLSPIIAKTILGLIQGQIQSYIPLNSGGKFEIKLEKGLKHKAELGNLVIPQKLEGTIQNQKLTFYEGSELLASQLIIKVKISGLELKNKRIHFVSDSPFLYNVNWSENTFARKLAIQ